MTNSSSDVHAIEARLDRLEHVVTETRHIEERLRLLTAKVDSHQLVLNGRRALAQREAVGQ